MHFSKKEIKDLLIAWLIISIAFAILFADNLFSYSFFIYLAISALTAGIGFLLHELMHKKVAQDFGLQAEFQAFYGGLFLALVLSFFGFIFAAPGAVVIRGQITREKNGKISLAGPLTNLVLAVLFLIPALILAKTGTINIFFNFGFKINALLALFNMIPVMPFDGAKVIAWSKPVYYATAILSLALFLASYLI